MLQIAHGAGTTEEARIGDLRVDALRPLSVPEVALALGCSASTVRRLCESGDLPAFRLGSTGSWRVRRADLEQFTHVYGRGEARAA